MCRIRGNWCDRLGSGKRTRDSLLGLATGTRDIAFLPAVDQAELIRHGQVSPVELVELYLERIERIDPALDAYVTVCAEEAVAAARARTAQPPSAPFHGVPIAIKDLTETAGIRTTFSCRAYADYVPDRDVAVVRRLREAGFVVLGKTNASELGSLALTDSGLNGPCRNPWNTMLNAGGSSGGAAAALAAGLCPVAHATDGGGSIRIPASCCGVVGLKPARGRISRAPYAGFEGLPTDGPITRTVRDAAALLDAMQGYEPGDAWWAPPPARPFVEEVGAPTGRLRIGVTTEPPLDVPVNPACARAARDVGDLLADLGHHVEGATPDWRGRHLLEEFTRVWQVGPALTPVEDRALLDPVNRALVEAAEATSSVDYAFAAVRLAGWGRHVVGFWNRFDVLVTPTLAMLPVPVSWLTGEESDADTFFDRGSRFTPFTAVANVTGLPAVSLPLAWHDGVPVGVQLIGGPADEATLIRLAAQLEEARPWRDRVPPLAN